MLWVFASRCIFSDFGHHFFRFKIIILLIQPGKFCRVHFKSKRCSQVNRCFSIRKSCLFVVFIQSKRLTGHHVQILGSLFFSVIFFFRYLVACSFIFAFQLVSFKYLYFVFIIFVRFFLSFLAFDIKLLVGLVVVVAFVVLLLYFDEKQNFVTNSQFIESISVHKYNGSQRKVKQWQYIDDECGWGEQ